MGRHRAGLRYRRVSAAGTAVLVTMVAVLGGTGVLPTSSSTEPAYAGVTDGDPRNAHRHGRTIPAGDSASDARTRLPRARLTASDVTLPEQSGTGRRVVFDMDAQRVWLVSSGRDVERTYLVSGGVTDNLSAGTYEVYSKSRHAVGIDDSGTMEYMVRFTRGERAAIGFHDIPVHQGQPVQTPEELGTPQSHGCIRQLHKDAKALWDFAPVGTTVVVLA